jgi:tRNA(Ile)-lysidine synthase
MPRPAPARDAPPVTPSEFSALMRPFAPFEARPLLALAVSGGRDSRALALLARHWAVRRGGRVVGLVVDHGLRDASAIEAAQTRAWLLARGIEAHVLRWQAAQRPRSGVQALARAARYRLLLAWCRRHGVLHLLTAHQADDQAETFALRAARGSGAVGLAAMSAAVEFPEARLLRPLLPVARVRLTATLQARGEAWIDDPSNADPRFARARLRRDGLPVRFEVAIRQAARFAVRRAADDLETALAIARCAVPHPLGGVLIDHAEWRSLASGQAQAVVASVIATVAGADYPPRRERTLRAVRQMRAVPRRPESAPAGMTLGGCRILWRGGGWLVVREPASMSTDLGEDAGGWGRWDGRFDVCGQVRSRTEISSGAPAPVASGKVTGSWRAAWPATPGLAAFLAAVQPLADDGALPASAVEGGRSGPTDVCDVGGDVVRLRFRPVRPIAPGPFFPCFATAKGQIVNR